MESRQPPKYAFIIGLFILIASVVIRLFSLHIQSNDYTDSLVPWFNTLSQYPGLRAFQSPFSDYAPLYLYIIKFLTLLPIGSLYSIKFVSILGDVLLAYVIYKIVRHIKRDLWQTDQYFLVFAIAFSIPTVMINSSLWGQCDSLYSSFVLLTLYFILKNRPLACALAFGVAVSFKLQAIFFLPIILGYLLSRKRNIIYLFAIPLVYLITVIPAGVWGGSFWKYLTIYFKQIGEYSALSLSAPSIYSFVSGLSISAGVESILSYLGITVAAIFICWLIWVEINLFRYEKVSSGNIIFLALLSVLVIPFLLPHMHERYFYLADTISILYAILNPRRFYVALLVVTASFFSYMPFLSDTLPSLSSLIFHEAILGILVLASIILLIRARKAAVQHSLVS